ncbi:MAG: chromosome segregation protein SMC, partial [Ruminococcus sp.]|nr:chromosome segregation protein SMC [Ruminococcus sp.]
VIFAGTTQRKAGGFAGVTLCIENEDGALPVEEKEVSVTRRLYRSGESEYMINGSPVRLKDVSELFMDTGLGRDGYSIIGQGRVAEIVSSKSGERRDIFEEAAGISKFRYRKAEAVRRLGQAQENIVRLTDILSELEERVGPLKVQSEKAAKFLELSEEKKSLEITAWMTELGELKVKLGEIEDKLLINTSEYDNVANAIEKLEEEQREAAKAVACGNILIERLQEDVLAAEKSNTDIHSDIAVFKNDIDHCEKTIEQLKKQAENAKLSDSENKRLTEEKIAFINQLGEDIKFAAKEYEDAAAELERAAKEEESFEKKAGGAAAELNGLYIKRSELTINAGTAENAIKEANEQRETLEGQIKSARESAGRLEESRKEVEDGLAILEKSALEQSNRAAGLGRLFEGREQKLKNAEKSASDMRMAVREKQQRIGILQDLENSMEGIANAPKQVLRAGKSGRIGGIIGSVAQLITVPPDMGTAVETALGGAVQNIVTETEDAAKRAIRMLKDMNGGRATFLPLTSVKGNRMDDRGLGDCMGFVAVASDVVECEERLRGIVNFLLGRTVIAEDIDCAGDIAKKFGYKFRIVTLDGQVVNAGGSYTGGSVGKTGGMLTRKNEIERLKGEIEEGEKSLAQAEKKAADLKAEVDKMRIDIEAANEEIRRIEQDRIRFEEELRHNKETAEQNETARTSAEESLGKISKKISDAMSAKERAESALEELRETISQKENAASEDSGKREEMRKFREELSAKMSDSKLKKAGLEKDLENAKESLKTLEEQSLQIGDSSVKLAMEEEEQRKIIREKERLIKEREEALKKAGDKTEEIRREIEKTKRENLEKEKISGELREQIKERNNEKERAGAEKIRLEERRDGFNKSCDKIISDMAEQYELYPSEAAALVIEGADKTDINGRLMNVRQKIRSLGSVNVAAIEEYKEVSERYEFMSGQLSDVNSSKRELEKLIDELTETMKIKFSESFKIINENFKSIFVELFGGGKAELVLSDPEDVLESGIEINVAPPGKVIKSLSLLSGGEQAFVAIAIYFAILKLKPAPFCILDEIEAALDDVNVSRYAGYLHRFTDTTQFITVTHRRGTMEEADILYGVTMQEKGISRLLRMEQPPEEEV